MANVPLIAHSLREIGLYLRATACPTCARGPLIAKKPVDAGEPSDEGQRRQAANAALVPVEALCRACGATTDWTFSVQRGADPSEGTPGNAINDGDEPSRIIDVGQWIMLSRRFMEDADRETDKVRARNLRIEAGECLEEAVKFYDDPDNDLPPAGAFFHETSRKRLRQAPEQFSRRRLIELRAKLPSPFTRNKEAAKRTKPTGGGR